MSILSLPPLSALLLASAILLAVAAEAWLRPRRPLWMTIVSRLAAFAVLTFLVEAALGSPLRPQFNTGHSGVLLWQQCVEVGWWILAARVIAAAMRALVALEGRPHESRIVSDLVAGAIYIATGLAITNFAFSLPIGGMLATSGVIAIVLGLALQSTLADVFSGIAVGLERAYKPGDLLWVEGDIEGTVVQVSWRSTQIQTRHNNIAIIPNSVIAKSRLINRSSPTPTRADTMAVRLDAHADPARCLTVLEAAVQTCMLPVAEPPPGVSYTGLTGDGGTYEIEYSVGSSDDLAAARTELLSQVHRHLIHAGIALAVAGTPHPPPLPAATIASMIDRSDLFGLLPDGEREEFARHFAAVSFEKSETLIREGEVADSVFLIAAGAVEVTAQSGGTQQIVRRIGPGEAIGLVGMLTDRRHPATGTALTQVESYCMDEAALTAALKLCPNTARGLKALALRQEKMLLEGRAHHSTASEEHGQMFLGRIRQALHRLAA